MDYPVNWYLRLDRCEYTQCNFDRWKTVPRRARLILDRAGQLVFAGFDIVIHSDVARERGSADVCPVSIGPLRVNRLWRRPLTLRRKAGREAQFQPRRDSGEPRLLIPNLIERRDIEDDRHGDVSPARTFFASTFIDAATGSASVPGLSQVSLPLAGALAIANVLSEPQPTISSSPTRRTKHFSACQITCE